MPTGEGAGDRGRANQKDPGTEVISIPLSVQPHSGAPHVTGVEGEFVMRPLTSVSKTHPPASPPNELSPPPDELSPEGLLDASLGYPRKALLPHPVAPRPAAVIVAMSRANPRTFKGLMCRSRSRPGWAS